MKYQKPVLGALSMESEHCGCNFFVNDSGQGFYVYTEGGTGLPSLTEIKFNPGAIAENNVASVGGNQTASVTPLANTGLPATQPIIIGVPVGVSGVQANVGPSGSNTSANVDTSSLALHLLGFTLTFPF